MAKILEGMRVLDFGRFGAAPICSALLENMGAEVIRIEHPRGEDDRDLPPFAPDGSGLIFVNCCAGKKGITLDLKSAGAEKILDRLVSRSDVLVHNFPPGSKEAAILDYDRMKKMNNKIVSVAVSAFGQDGPYANMNGFDAIAQAMSGAMSFTGFPGPPCRSGVGVADWTTGLCGALGAVSALFHRQRTGEGQLVDVSLLDSAVYLVAGTGAIADYVLNGVIRSQLGNQSWYCSNNCFKAKDGWVMIAAGVDPLWRRAARVMGREDLLADERFKSCMSRFTNREVLNPLIAEWVEQHTVNEVVTLLQNANVPAGPAYGVDEVARDPHISQRQMIAEVECPTGEKVPIAGFPIKFSSTPGEVKGRAPRVGEHNREVYCDLFGFSDQEFSSFKADGTI